MFVFTGRFGTPIDPRTLNRTFTAQIGQGRRAARSPCTTPGGPAATLLADLDVHPRVAMQILRHADFSVTMEIYTQVSSKQTREALKKLGESLG